MNRKIAVFCGRDYGPNKDTFQKLALLTGKTLAEHGFTTATGGGPGMMSDVNQGAIEAGGKVISVQFGFNDEHQSPYFTEKHHFEDLRERQKFLVDLADGLCVLPGGVGTLYEAIEVLSMKRVHKIALNKPLIFIGDDFFDPLQEMLLKLEKEEFIPYKVKEACSFAKNPADAVNSLKAFFEAK